MIQNKSIPSNDLIYLENLRKLLKASYGVWYIFEEDTIIVYGMHDSMFTIISRIIVPNITSIKSGTLCFDNHESEFSDFCKTLIPLIDIELNKNVLCNKINNTLMGSCRIDNTLEGYFIQKRNKLNDTIDHYTSSFSVSQDVTIDLKTQLLAMRATMSQKFFSIADRFLITIYSGLLPVNKPDSLNIDVVYGNSTFLCKYEVLKKKAPSPIHVFVKYRRL